MNVAFIIYNRPDLTSLVFEQIRAAKPERLLVIADGPKDRSGQELCLQTRAVIEKVDWECEVLRNYSDVNLGCRERVSSGLNWVFEHVDEAIILEDDCLPDPSFFPFCCEMLATYRDNPKVLHIAGTNLLPQPHLEHSYLFSRLVPIWGWATWRRAWAKYDGNMESWTDYCKTGDIEYFGSEVNNVFKVFESASKNLVDTWDSYWAFTCVKEHGLSIIPKENLIKNIGFRVDATHTKNECHLSGLPARSLVFPLEHPVNTEVDRKFDIKYLSLMNNSEINNFQKRMKVALRKMLKSLIK